MDRSGVDEEVNNSGVVSTYSSYTTSHERVQSIFLTQAFQLIPKSRLEVMIT